MRSRGGSCHPIGAALVAITALVWSVPNYPASVPSWFNLFFATFGTLALLRGLETGRRRWMVLAGLAGGVSFLFKLSGVFYLLGARHRPDRDEFSTAAGWRCSRGRGLDPALQSSP